MGKRSYNKHINYDSLPIDSAMSTRYVYFSSILSEPKKSPQYKMGKQAQSQLNIISNSLLSNSETEGFKSEGKIINALKFLQQAAEFERTKEIQFFQNYRSQYSDVLDSFKFDSINGENLDYEQFITDINIAIKGLSSFKNELNTEVDRIQRMRDADTLAKANYKNINNMSDSEKEQYFKDINNIKANAMTAGGTKAYAGGTEAFFLQRASNETIGSLVRNGSLNAEITQLVIEEYGSQLFSEYNGKLKLNASLIAILIKVINDKIYSELINKYQSARRNEITSSRLKQIAVSDDVKEYVENLMKNEGLRSSLQSIAEQHNISDITIQQANINQEQIKAVTEKIRAGYEKMRTANMPPFEEWLNQHKEFNIEEIVRTANAAKSQAYYTGEDMSLMTMIAAGFSGILGGGANPTDDWEAGKLVINIDIDDTKLQNTINNESRELSKLQEQYFNEVTRTTDLVSFQENTRRLRELREKQEAILKKINNKITKTQLAAEYLITHMNVHGTVKGYQSAGRDTFEKYGGFEGAAFGSNLTNQLNIITSSAGSNLLGSSGISEEDKQWLHFAMINAGKQMLGAYLKPTLENYFSIFVGFFMFNDAALMIEDAANFMKNQYSLGAQDLHIYQLNGLLVPASYLLQQTYNSLLPLATNISAQLNTSQSTRAILHTYNGGPVSRDWASTTKAAEKATYLEMKFLAGFMDLLNNISNKINQM